MKGRPYRDPGGPYPAVADGPDEVHKILVAKNVLKMYRNGESWDFGL